MNDQEYNLLMKQVKQLQKENSKEASLERLVSAGILTPKGNFRKPYKSLSKLFVKTT